MFVNLSEGTVLIMAIVTPGAAQADSISVELSALLRLILSGDYRRDWTRSHISGAAGYEYFRPLLQLSLAMSKSASYSVPAEADFTPVLT